MNQLFIYEMICSGLMAHGRSPRNIRLLVHSLLDKYNEDHHLLEDLAYELEEVVSFGEMYEGMIGFLHINLTAKTKGDDGLHSVDNNLFFAEVIWTRGENEEYVLNCLCMIKPNDKGRCYGCQNYGCVDLKHPTTAHKYKGGHCRPSYPRCCALNSTRKILDGFREYELARLAGGDSKIRHMDKCLDDLVFVAKQDGATAHVGSSRREDGQGMGLGKYIVPARRRQLG